MPGVYDLTLMLKRAIGEVNEATIAQYIKQHEILSLAIGLRHPATNVVTAVFTAVSTEHK